MTFKYNNVYVQDTATVAGPYEKKGPLKKYFDKTFDDLYFKEKSLIKNVAIDSIPHFRRKDSKKSSEIVQ